MITYLYISIYGFVLMALSLNVIKGRRVFNVDVGDGGNILLLRSISAQANFVEYTAFFSIQLYLAEVSHMAYFFLHLFGIVFLLGRLSHAYGLLRAETMLNRYRFNFRGFGMIATFACIGLLSVYLLISYIIA